MPSGSFTASAYVHVARWQHHRLRDHFGVESDLFVVLNERIGPWEQGTPVHFVIDDLISRLVALESAAHIITSFTCNSYLLAPGTYVEEASGTWRSFAWADAIVLGTVPVSSFTAGAWLVGGGVITVNAVLRGANSFTASAVLV